jgi:hypothetical protein
MNDVTATPQQQHSVARKLKLSIEKITKHGALPDLALVGIATLEDATVGAATDTVNRTSSPHMSSTDRCLKCFTERITKVRQPPLLDLPGDDTTHGGRTLPALAPQEEQADSDAEHISYPGFQTR